MSDQAQAPVAPAREVSRGESVDTMLDGLDLKGEMFVPVEKPTGRDDKGRYAKAADAETEAGEEGTEAPEAPAVEADEDYIELPGEGEGAEPQKLKLAEVLDGFKRAKDLEQQLSQQGALAPEAEQLIIAAHQSAHEYHRGVAALAQMLQPQMPPDDMINPQSPSYDPEGYYTQRQQALQVHDMRQRFAAEAQRVAEEQEQREALIHESRLRRETEEVKRVWPELLSNPQTRKAVSEEFTRAYRFTPEEINGVADSRMFAVMKDALAYRQLMAAQGKAAKAVAAKPKLVRASARQQATGRNAAASEAMSRLRKSGSPDDAVAALANLLG